MGLFRRNATSRPQEVVADLPHEGVERPDVEPGAPADDAGRGPGDPGVSRPSSASGRGPHDVARAPEASTPRVDLGALLLTPVAGMELRMEIDRRTQRVTGATVVLEGSTLQLQAFAAPRSEGVWDDIRTEIATSIEQQGGSVDDLPGPFGRELLAQVPAAADGGKKELRPVRFLGVDGPRWFLRGVLTGRAAVDSASAQALEDVFAATVVVRGQDPRPPRDLLPLNLPGGASPATPAAGGDGFDPLTRGPEITEIR